MKEKRLRRTGDHLPAGVELSESSDERGKRHISIVATQGSANLRDIATLRPEDLQLGRVYASSDDISNQQLQEIGVKTFLDLRVPQKLFTFAELRLLRSDRSRKASKVPDKELAEKYEPRRRHAVMTVTSAAIRPCFPKRNLPPRCRFCSAALAQRKGCEITVFHVELMQTSAKASVFMKLPRTTKWQILTACCRRVSPKVLAEDNIGDEKPISYADLYRILFDHGKKQFAQAMRIFSRAELYPILIHCQHGLDRTGMVVLLLMMLCHLPVKALVHQYVQSETSYQESDGERMKQEDKEMFADSILKTIEYFLKKWGTAEQYALSIGLRGHELLAIKRNILAQGRHETLEVPDLVNPPFQPNRGDVMNQLS